MDYEIVNIREGLDIDANGHKIRNKIVRFKVNDGEHTLKISMSDFDKGRTRELLETETKKILAIYGKK